MSLPYNIRETASVIYRNLNDKMEVKGKSVVCMSAAVIFTACRQCGTIRSIEEICKSMCEASEVKAKSKLATKYYRNMVIELGTVMAPSTSINTYISRIANVTKIDARVERTALELAEKDGHWWHYGRQGTKWNSCCLPIHCNQSAWTQDGSKRNLRYSTDNRGNHT